MRKKMTIKKIKHTIYMVPLVLVNEDIIKGKITTRTIGQAICSTEAVLRSVGKKVFSSDTILGLVYKTQSGRIKLLNLDIFDDMVEKPLSLNVSTYFDGSRRKKKPYCHHHKIAGVHVIRNDYWDSKQ